jgi:hypothetical protein
MGLIFDDRGNPMSPSHANKKGVQMLRLASHPAKPEPLLRAAAARSIDALSETIRLAVDAFTPTECRNYFATAGYDAI